MKYLIVCHGNICRSPLASVVLHTSGLTFRQGGFVNPGRRSPPKVRRYAAAAGFGLEDHRSKLIEFEDTVWADRIVYMDKGNYRRVIALNPNAAYKTLCLANTFEPPEARVVDVNFVTETDPAFKATCDKIVAAAREIVRLERM